MHEPGGAGRNRGVPSDDSSETRTWVHPSELGLRTRTRSDHRRGAWLAVGLTLVGVGLLAFVITMDHDGTGTRTTTLTASVDTVSATLAQVTVVRGEDRSTVTGVVLDRHGHVAVRAEALDSADAIWVSSGGRDARRAAAVDIDHASGVAVLTMPERAGTPAMIRSSTSPGDEVFVTQVGTGEAAPTVEHARVQTTRSPLSGWASGNTWALIRVRSTTGSASVPDSGSTSASVPADGRITTTTASRERGGSPPGTEATPSDGDRDDESDDGAAFDRSGRLVGLVVDGDGDRLDLVPAATLVQVAASLSQ